MPAEQTPADARRRAAREVIDILHEIATLLVRARAHDIHGAILNKLTEHPPRPTTALLLRLAY